MNKKVITATLSALLLIGITGCSSSNQPTTVAAAQTSINSTFATWGNQIPNASLLLHKEHIGRSLVGANCSTGQVQIYDTDSYYMNPNFDTAAFLNKFKTYLTQQKLDTTTSKTQQGDPAINVVKDNYAYTIYGITHVVPKKEYGNTTKAIVLQVTSTCVNPK